MAVAVTLAYALALAPSWEPELQDQEDYLALARGLAARAEYTTAGQDEAFRPELRRVPGYPLLLAPLCRVSGCEHWHVALVQSLLNASLVPLTYALARRMTHERMALIAAAAVAAYPTFAYFAALTLSDLPATAVFMAALVLAVRARESGSLPYALAAGAAIGLAALTRSVLAPTVIPVAVFLMVARQARLRLTGALLTGVVLVVAPVAAHSYASFGTLPSSAGEGLWYGWFQGRALLPDPDPAACGAFAAGAVPSRLPAIPGLDAFETEMAHRGQCRRQADLNTFVATGSPAVWLALERELRADAVRLIAHDPFGWTVRGLTFRSLALWARDEPLPTRIARELPAELRSGLVAAQLLLLSIASLGLVRAARHGGPVGVLAASIVACVWVSSVMFWAEARYVLPVRPLFLIGVALGAGAIAAEARMRLARGPRPSGPAL